MQDVLNLTEQEDEAIDFYIVKERRKWQNGPSTLKGLIYGSTFQNISDSTKEKGNNIDAYYWDE